MKATTVALAIVALVAAGAGGWYWQSQRPQAPPAAAQERAPAPAPPASPVAASAPAIAHPVVIASAPGLPESIDQALATLFGARVVQHLFRTDEVARRFVATVDNLGREHASAALWPVEPTGGRFGVVVSGGGNAGVVSADNGLRYAPYVQLLEQLDLAEAMRAYKQFYPALQQAYVDLGYPHGYFNDRFVAVLDQLIATPEAPSPLHVHRPVVEGASQPTRPWVLYEFDDPALESLSSGQRTLLRMGTVDERRVKARLVELRRLLVAG